MRNVLLMSSALCAAAVVSFEASAADYRQPKALPPVVQPFVPTGPYVGLHIGYAWPEAEEEFLDGFVPPFPLAKTGDAGLAGFYAGYNWMLANNWLWGVEGDLSYIASERDTWSGSLRLRAGPMINQTLYYLHGGLAFGQFSPQINGFVFGSQSFAESDTEYGWTVGAGIEHWFTERISFKGEYRYIDMGHVATVFPFPGDPPIARIGGTAHTVRVGIALHW